MTLEDHLPPDLRGSTTTITRIAADAGLAPRIVHVDEPGRAVLTAFVVDRSFPAFYRDPGTHEAALRQLGRTVRRIHALPIPADAPLVENRHISRMSSQDRRSALSADLEEM
jgi:hypothetical protein